MKTQFLLYIFFALHVIHTQAQQTVGLFLNSSNAFDGYTLFAPINSTETYLIDNCGEKVHSWSSSYRPGLSCYLLEDGTLLRTGRIPLMGSGIVEMIDWDGNVIWSYSSNSTHGKQHHDIAPLPNGNILLIVNDERSQSDLEAVGSSTNNAIIISEQIIEIEPDIATGGTTVVWEWKAWDHLIQDSDIQKPNHGIISEHPERIDINFINHTNPDWLHINGVDYNKDFDQIILSVRSFSEFWIIDHSTNTSESVGSSGGKYGKGGDLLYRRGNPQAYDQGDSNDQKLFLQHHAQWIPETHSDAGKILLFNNQAGAPFGLDYSTIDIINTPVGDEGFYTFSGGAYEPADFDWTYQAPIPTDFFSRFISGVQRLQNGNTLICEGLTGRFFEIDENENIVWEYVNPVNNLGAISQNSIPLENNVFRSTKYAAEYLGFEGHTLEPQGFIEIGSTFDCDSVTSTDEDLELTDAHFFIYPNPANEYLSIQIAETVTNKDFKSLKIYSMSNALVYHSAKLESIIEVVDIPKGFYFVELELEKVA